MPETLQEQLVKHLTDVHSIEEQALLQMRVAPRMAHDPELARAFREHIAETEEQERLVRGRLQAHAADPSRVKDLIACAGGVGMVLFARSQPDTPGKLVAHAYSYEHMELAAYELLAIVARRADDTQTAEVAGSIGEQEAAMAQRLAAGFDRAVEASLRDVPTDDLGKQLGRYLSDAHEIEAQALQLLEQAQANAGEPNLKKAFADHLEETRSQQAAVEARLAARDEGPSRVKNIVMRIGGLNLGAFFGSQPDTPAKLAGFRSPSNISRWPPTNSSCASPNGPAMRRPPAWPSASLGRSAPPPRPSALSSSRRWRLRSASRASVPLDEGSRPRPASSDDLLMASDPAVAPCVGQSVAAWRRPASLAV